MKAFLKYFLILGWLLFSSFSWAQVTTKHPRVVELEKSMTKDAMDFLKGRFPSHPFLVSISIDPLHREKPTAKNSSDSLPYYEIGEGDITDEWDDPALSSSALQARVKKIALSLSIPATLSDDEIAELRQALINNLALIEARDSIEIRKRSFSSNEVKEDRTVTFLGWGAFAWLALMLGLMGVVWVSANRISSAFAAASAKARNSEGASNNAPMPMFNTSGPESLSEKGHSSNISGDIRFNDPIKMHEVISSSTKRLIEQTGFPNLEDMLTLHKMAEENPASLGALLSEFPPEVARKIFSLSFGNNWLEAMHEPGELDSVSMTVLNKLTRTQRSDLDCALQDLLIHVWRLEEKQSTFFKNLPREEAFAILSRLPSSVAIASARTVFPGAWAAILDNSTPPLTLPSERIKQLLAMTQELQPPRDWSIIESYKKERELLSFLKTCDTVAEKEIYTASSNPTILESIRPPFYKVYDLNDNEYDKLVPLIALEEWALVFFNTSRSDRKNIEKRFSDKQRFRYFEILKYLDSHPPTPTKVGEARQKVGKLIQQIIKFAPSGNHSKTEAVADAHETNEPMKQAS